MCVCVCVCVRVYMYVVSTLGKCTDLTTPLHFAVFGLLAWGGPCWDGAGHGRGTSTATTSQVVACLEGLLLLLALVLCA